jgi:hypothetical protein
MTLSEQVQRGRVDALTRFGFKHAAEELRLKLPTRTFHGLDAAHKTVATRAAKQGADTADGLAHLFSQVGSSTPTVPLIAAPDPLDRETVWGAPSSLSAGDTAGRLSDMGQQTHFGGI